MSLGWDWHLSRQGSIVFSFAHKHNLLRAPIFIVFGIGVIAAAAAAVAVCTDERKAKLGDCVGKLG